MQFYYGGKTWDTDKPVYVVGHRYKDGSWFPFRENQTINANVGWTVKCKRGTIRNINVDYNFGQSFVCGFEIYVPSYDGTLRTSEVIIAGDSAKGHETVGAENQRGVE